MLTKHIWVKGYSETTAGQRCSFAHPDIEKMDLTDYIKLHYSQSEWDETFNKIKTIYRICFRDKYDSCKTIYYTESGQKKDVYPLWKLNDQLDWHEAKQLLNLM